MWCLATFDCSVIKVSDFTHGVSSAYMELNLKFLRLFFLFFNELMQWHFWMTSTAKAYWVQLCQDYISRQKSQHIYQKEPVCVLLWRNWPSPNTFCPTGRRDQVKKIFFIGFVLKYAIDFMAKLNTEFCEWPANKSTNKWVKIAIRGWKEVAQTQQQWPKSSMVTLTWHVSN